MSFVPFRCLSNSKPLWNSIASRRFGTTMSPIHLLLSSFNKTSSAQHILKAPMLDGGIPGPFTHHFSIPTASPLYASGSTNGLVCLRCAGRNKHPMPIFVCNPATREIVSLPVDNAVTLHVRNEDKHSSFTGFGFDPVTQQHGVVNLLSIFSSYPRSKQDDETGEVRFFNELYFRNKGRYLTLGFHSWKDTYGAHLRPCFVDADCPCFERYYNPMSKHTEIIGHDVCVSGKIFWMTRNKENIVSFDLTKKKFSSICTPYGYKDRNFGDRGDRQCLVKCGENLAIFGGEPCYSYNCNMVDLWTLKDYNKQLWVKESIGPVDWKELRGA